MSSHADSATAALPPRAGSSDLVARIVLVIAALAFVGLRIPCVSIPLERDEGEYAYIAQRMLLGELPYRDAFDQKPPGAFFAYLLPVAAFGTSVAAIHVMLYAFTAATAVFVYLITLRVAGRPASALAALVFSLISLEPAWLATAANTEQLMLLPMTAGVWFALRAADTGRRGSWLICGACTAAACWFKQVAAANVLLIGAIGAYHWFPAGRRRSPAGILRDIIAFGGGVALVAAPVPLWFALRGGWSEFVDCVWTHNIRYAGQATLAEGLDALGAQLAWQAGSLWWVWLLALATCLDVRPGRRSMAAMSFVWLAASAAGISVGLYFREHYFIQAAPALALAAGTAAARLAAWLARPFGPTGAAAVGVAIALLMPLPMLQRHRGFWTAAGPEARARYLYGLNPFAESAAIASWIAASTAPDDRVFILGSEPQILFLAERRSATRYIFVYPLMLETDDALARQREALEEIRAARPACIILTHLQASMLVQPRSHPDLVDEVFALVERDYRLAGLRACQGAACRMVFDAEAQALYDAAVRQRRTAGLDMLLFVRK